MNSNTLSEDQLANASREDIISAQFANMVIQQTNMAFMLLGKVPHPETGEVVNDVESAKMFIDQLEMLEVKTKGNLNKREEGLLQQSLTALRMTFVEAVEGKSSERPPASPPPKTATPQPQAAPQGQAAPGATQSTSEADADAESRKKFTKKY